MRLFDYIRLGTDMHSLVTDGYVSALYHRTLNVVYLNTRVERIKPN